MRTKNTSRATAPRGYVVASRRNGSICGCMGPYSTRKVAQEEARSLPLAGAEAVVLGASDDGFRDAWGRLSDAYRETRKNSPAAAALAALEAKEDAKRAARAVARETTRAAGDVGEALAELVTAARKRIPNSRRRGD